MGETFINFFFNGKERKLKAFVMRNAQNLFGTDWMEEFDLSNVPINTFCNKKDGTTTSSDKLKKELKLEFPEIFSEGHGSIVQTWINTSDKLKKELKLEFPEIFSEGHGSILQTWINTSDKLKKN